MSARSSLLLVLALVACAPLADVDDAWLGPPEVPPGEEARLLQVSSEGPTPPNDDDDVVPDDDDSAATACEDDHFEPNHSAEQGWPIEPGLYPFLVSCDPDYFVLDLVEGDVLRVDLGFDGAHGGVALWLGDPTGQSVLDEERLEGEPWSVVVDVAGLWTVAVEQLEDEAAQPGVAYSLSVDVTALQCDPGPFEPNDSDLAPWPMGQGSWAGLRVCPFEDDFFAVWLEPGHGLEAAVAFDPVEGDLVLTLFGPSLVLLDSGEGDGGIETVAVTATVAGWHVLWVELVQDGGAEAGVPYVLTIDLP